MRYLSVAQTAARWGVSERSVRNYCAQGRVTGAFLTGKTWNIPEDAEKPRRANARRTSTGATYSATTPLQAFGPAPSLAEVCPSATLPLLTRLREEKASGMRGGIYHNVQVELAFNSNRIEGSRLSLDQTRMIFETSTIGFDDGPVRVDDIVETANHFRAFDYIVDNVEQPLSEQMCKDLHRILKTATSDAALSWFAVGDYKRLPNEVAGRPTTAPEDVAAEMGRLIGAYGEGDGNANAGDPAGADGPAGAGDPAGAGAPAGASGPAGAGAPDALGACAYHTLDDIIDFHVRFERIHPFQDGNGRVGRLIMFKECLANGIVPFIIGDDMHAFYYRGLAEWDRERGYLRDTCLAAQDRFAATLEYFRIAHS